MQKIFIYYPDDNKMLIPGIGIEFDGKNYYLEKNQEFMIETEIGVHDLKIIGGSFGDVNKEGLEIKREFWIDDKINVDKDLYLIFKSPLVLSMKGKVKYLTKEKYERVKKKNTFWNSKLGLTILIVACIVIYIIFS